MSSLLGTYGRDNRSSYDSMPTCLPLRMFGEVAG
jgi:hypothetical protein